MAAHCSAKVAAILGGTIRNQTDEVLFQDIMKSTTTWLCGGARYVVAVARIEACEIELVVDQVVHGVFESAGQKLLLQVYGEESWTGVDVFVARHLLLQNVNLHFDLDIYFSSRQDARMKILFLQLR